MGAGPGSSELDSEALCTEGSAGTGCLLWIEASESSRSSATVAVREPGEDGGATGFEYCDGCPFRGTELAEVPRARSSAAALDAKAASSIAFSWACWCE